MKRFLFAALFAVSAFAQSRVQQTTTQLGNTNNWVVAFNWTGDISSGAVPITVARLDNCCQGYLITQVETVPGSVAPTSGYSVAINDAAGVDALGGVGASLSNTAAQSFPTSLSSPPVQGTFSLVITGQSVGGATGKVYVFLSKPGSVNVAALGGSQGFFTQTGSRILRTVQAKLAELGISPADFAGDPTGTLDSTAAIQAAVTAAALRGACVILNGGQYKVTGSISSPALGQACLRGNYNAVPYTGNLSGTPPRSASLIQQQNNAKTISLTGVSNVVDGLDFTIASGVTGVTAIFGTDTLTQPFTHSRITNNTIHGYSTGVTQGTYLAAGIDIESIGANSNNNTLTGNKVQLATYGYILRGASTSAVVNANIFHNWAMSNTHAALLTNSGEMGEFWLSMEGNGDAVTGVGVCCTDFHLDNGEQAQPHLILSGGSHDNTLWGGSRGQVGGQIGMTVTSDSMVNNLIDLSSIWHGITTAGIRYWCFGCVTQSANYTPNLSVMQHQSDASGTRSTYRIAHSVNVNTASDLSYTPQGCDSLGNCGFYHATETSYDFTKPIATWNQMGTQPGNTPYAYAQLQRSGAFLGDTFCQAINTAAIFTTGCGWRVQVRGSAATVIPLFVQGDGVYQNNLALPSAAVLPTCNAGTVSYTVPNYPFATSATLGAAPGSGGTFNVSIRCDFDGATYAWHIH